MRAVAIDEYGGTDALRVRDVDEPKVGPDTVLVEVAAASINPVDDKVLQGMLDGRFPALWPLVLGWDVAGRGPAVTEVEESMAGVGGKVVLTTGAGS